jgi:hypothetical protein
LCGSARGGLLKGSFGFYAVFLRRSRHPAPEAPGYVNSFFDGFRQQGTVGGTLLPALIAGNPWREDVLHRTCIARCGVLASVIRHIFSPRRAEVLKEAPRSSRRSGEGRGDAEGPELLLGTGPLFSIMPGCTLGGAFSFSSRSVLCRILLAAVSPLFAGLSFCQRRSHFLLQGWH